MATSLSLQVLSLHLWIRIFSFFRSLHSKQRDFLFCFVVQTVMDKDDGRMHGDGGYAVIDRNECVLSVLFVVLNRNRDKEMDLITKYVLNRMPEQKGIEATSDYFELISLYFLCCNLSLDHLNHFGFEYL